jgi:hypothetical protein
MTPDILTTKVLEEVKRLGWKVRWSHPDALEVGSSTELEVPGNEFLGVGPYTVSLCSSFAYGYVKLVLTTGRKSAEWHGLRPGLQKILNHYPGIEFVPNYPILALTPTSKTLNRAEEVIECINQMTHAATMIDWAIKRALAVVAEVSEMVFE